MKKRFIQLLATAFILILGITTSFAQSGSWNYVVTSGPSVPANMTGATVIGAGADDVLVNFKWPFPALIYDDLYTALDDIYINSNGVIRFDDNLYVGAGAGPIPTFPSNNTTFRQCITYGGNSDGHVSGNFVQKVTGAVGSRVLTMAFTYYTYYSGTTSYHADVQVSYYELDHVIKVDYSNVGGTHTPATGIGINAGDGTWGANYLPGFPTQDTNFTFTPGATFAPPASFTATANSSNKITLNWAKNVTNSDVLLVYNTTNSFANPLLGTSYVPGQEVQPGQGRVLYVGGNLSQIVDTIPPSQIRYYKIWSKLTGNNYYSSTALTANATTFALAPPTSFAVTNAASNSIDLSWVLNAYSDSVIITYNTSNTFSNPNDQQQYLLNNQILPGQGTVVYKGTGTTFSHTNLLVNTQYFYQAWSYNDGHFYSIPVAINGTTSPPTNPTGFSATASGASLINLAWTLSGTSNIILAYNTTGVFGTPQTGNNIPIGNTISGAGTGTVIVNGNTTTFPHTGLSSNTTYYYKIWTYDATYNYSSGAIANATTVGVIDPASFTAVTASSSSIDLTWTANTANDSVMIVVSQSLPFATPFPTFAYWVGGQIAQNQDVIYRGLASGSPWQYTGLTANTKYYFKIWSYNSANLYSSPGLIDSATTMTPGIAVFPYVEDFETQATNQGNVTGCQTYFPLSTGWQNVQTVDDIDWVARKGTTPTGNYTGPIGDHTTAAQTGTYLYTESTSCYNKDGWLVSPLFNFTNLTNPQMEFYYHMYGATMGNLSVQVSTNAGTTWSTTNLFYKSGQQHTSGSAAYTMALVNLGAYAGLSDIKIRIKGVTGSSWRSDMAIDDIKIYEPTPMSITSVTTEQDADPVVLGAINQQVIRVKINTVGDYNLLSLDSLAFNILGTTSPSDISSPKVYYTGNNPNFSASQIFGTATLTANTFNVTGSRVLAEGVNYFWLTYDITSVASALGRVVDAECTIARIASTDYIPTVTAPPGTKTIVGRIIVGTGTANEWQGPVYPPQFHSAHESIYTAAELGATPKEINKISWYKASGTNITDQINLIKIYMKNSTVSTFSNGTYSLAGYSLVYTGPMVNNKTTGWMETTLSNTFLYNGTGNVHVLVVQTKPSSTWSPYPYYRYSTTSTNQVRRAYNWNTAPTNLAATNRKPNIRFEYLLPAQMVYVSSTVIQPNTKNVGVGDLNQEIIGIKIVTQNTITPLSVTSLDLSTLGSTAPADILNAKVYYSGSNPDFAASGPFGSVVTSPSGTFIVSQTAGQTLVPGDNYFWVAYDIKTTAIVNNVVDARCNSITIGGLAKTPTITNPTGNRIIKKYITIGNVNLSSSSNVQPLHTYYNHAWEGIYTSAEMGTAKDVTALAFYKKSGTNSTNSILNVTIYMKHTTATTLATGTYSTSGYTQVFNGNFPNDATSGWMQVPFTNAFSYDGTQNVEVLIVQSRGAWFNGAPSWSYNTKIPNRARYANNYNSAPTSLTSQDRLASVRFEYEPPMPMTYVSTTTSQGNITNIVRGIPGQEILGIQVVTNNSANPLSVTSFSLNTTGSSQTVAGSDITNATIYYTGNSSTFAALNPMGASVNPNGNFTINGSQTLTSGINYFWLAYDVPATATLGNHVDAGCTSVMVSSSAKTPTVTAPAGNRTIVGAMSGYYTIGTGGDYATFGAAITALNSYGVSGWVTFRVFDGTYNEQITLASVSNTSAIRPVTFESFSGDSSLVILSSSNSNTNRATLTIDGASFYKIRNMTIRGQGQYSTAIELRNGANGNLIRNNRILSTGTQTYYSTGVYAYNTNAYDNRIAQNHIQTNGYGVYFRGPSTSSLMTDVEVDSNTIITGQYGCYAYYMGGLKFRNNSVTVSGDNNGYGMYMFYADNVDVSANKFAVSGTFNAYGFYIRTSDGTSTSHGRIYNNFISTLSNSSNRAVGIYTYQNNYLDIYYNNINITSTSSNTRAAIFTQQDNNLDLKNNVLAAPGGGYAIDSRTTGSPNSSNYNNLYSTGSIGYYGGSIRTNLAAWKTATGKDANSVSMNPQFVSSTDLHIGNLAMNNLGSPIAGITRDIDDTLRDATTPDIGADEFTIDIDAELTAVTSPTSPICGGAQNVAVTLKNNGVQTLTSATINWTVGGVGQMAFAWTGSLTTGNTVNVILGNYNFATLGSINITAQVTNPNGQTDAVPGNNSTSAVILVNGAATAIAGPFDTLCGPGPYVLSNASATSYSAILWSTSGSGTFTNGNTVNASYTPSAADITAGMVQLRMYVTGLGTCGNASDTMGLTMGSLPTVSFTGLANDYCETDMAAMLIGVPTTGTFSGTGISGNQFDPAVAGSGTHSITYSVNSNGCIGTDVQSVNVHGTPVANAGPPKTINPPTTTTATLNGSFVGGTNVGYFWNPSSLLNNAYIASPTTTALTSTTTFTLETKDTINGCSTTDQVLVTVFTPGNLTVLASATPAAVCIGDSTMLSAMANGGSGTYTYSWTSVPVGFTSTAQQINVSPMVFTTYTVVVNDGTNSANSLVGVTVNPKPVVSFTGLNASACNNGVAMNLSGTPSGGTFSSNGTGITGSMFSPSAAGVGTSYVYYSYSDANGCSSSDTQSVVVNDAPIANAGGPATIVQGNDTILYGSATGGGNYLYNWAPTSMLVNPNNQTPNETTIILNATQAYTLTVIDSITSCQSSDNMTVTVTGGVLTVNVTADKNSICDGDTVHLDAVVSGGTGNYTYTWSSTPVGFTSNLANPEAYPNVTTVYSVVVNDGTNTVSSSVTITVNPTPLVSISGLQSSYCENAIPDTLAGIPNGGLFTGVGISANIFNPSVAGVGNHTVSYFYTATNGCSATATQNTTVNDVPVANAGVDQNNVTFNTSTTLNGSATGGNGTYSYTWTPASLLTNANIQSPTTVLMQLTTIFTLDVSDVNNCMSTDDVQIKIQGGPLSVNPSATPDTICAGDPIQLNALASGGSGNYIYAWVSNPSGFIDLTANPIAYPTVTTTYIINVYDGANTVVDSVTVEVGAIPTVTITAPQAIYCDNGVVDTLIGMPMGGTFFGTGMINNQFDPNMAGIGLHQVIYKYTSSLGCSNGDTVNMNVVGAPMADAGSDLLIVCGGTGGMIGSAPVSGLTYSWNPSAALGNPNTSQTNANPSMSTLYTVTVLDPISTCTNTDDVQVDITGGPMAIVSNDTIICAGEPVTISAAGGTGYLWSNGVINQSFTVSPSQTTVYTVIVSDTSACTAVDSVIVTVNNPYIFLGPDLTVVDTTSVILDAGYGYVDYKWSTGDITQSIIIDPYINAQLGINTYSVQVTDVYGCIAADTIEIDYVLTVSEASKDISFGIYPNPTTGQFNIVIEGTIHQSFSLDIMNLEGRLIKHEKIFVNQATYTQQIDLLNFAKGVYMVRLMNEGLVITKKLIVQ